MRERQDVCAGQHRIFTAGRELVPVITDNHTGPSTIFAELRSQMGNMPVLLDTDHLYSVTMGDRELMREILSDLVHDTSEQLRLMAAAILSEDSDLCLRRAHYLKGAFGNVGACSAATLVTCIEEAARQHNYHGCAEFLGELFITMEQLRVTLSAM
jgi:HPt (histidine-containing phosphotransfer) domain-containing protein